MVALMEVKAGVGKRFIGWQLIPGIFKKNEMHQVSIRMEDLHRFEPEEVISGRGIPKSS